MHNYRNESVTYFDNYGIRDLFATMPDKFDCYLAGNNSTEILVCSICLGDIKLNEDIFVLSCEHKFHSECCVKWLSIKSICPVCKRIQST